MIRSSPRGKGILTILLLEQYRKIRDDFLKKRNQHLVIKPLMKYREIIIIEELLANLQPKRCLEWGSGYSTLYFHRLLESDAHWLAIEHCEDWATKINTMTQNPRVEAVFVPPNAYPWTDEHDDGAYFDLADYVEYPKKDAPYDFILVDGRARNDCLARAYDWITDDGVVVLHDSKRPYYHESLKPFTNQVFFTHKASFDKGLWIGSKRVPIEVHLNIARHQRVWHLHNLLRDFKHSRKSTLLQPRKHSKMG